ncbi:MAG: MFS transporter [Acidobacteriota bacterium]|nr:MFS transporter [Acidobacteriota bacterium]
MSFFTDTASEMVYPLLPLFLTRVLGAGAMSLGVIEGLAEAANSALKIISGRVADRTGRPKRLMLFGYGLSSSVRPLIAVASSWGFVLAIRFTDRLGKGIRGAPRDAMLADFAPEGQRGRVFGFHRAMDHSGAVLGPLLASLFLYVYPGEYRTLFALTIIPGVIVIAFILAIPEPVRVSAPAPSEKLSARSAKPSAPCAKPSAPSAKPSAPPAKQSAPSAKLAAPSAKLSASPASLSPLASPLGVIFLFALGNASDAFLLLRLSDIGIDDFWIPLLWSALHVVKVGSSLLGGALSDRFGRRHTIAFGWLFYAAVYAAFAFVDADGWLIAIFLAYGVYFGFTEGVEKAWIADLAPLSLRGTAFGYYNAVIGVGALLASVISGLIWTRVSPEAAFLTGAALAVAATLLLYFSFPDEANSRHKR